MEATNKVFKFDGTNQNTLAAWIGLDTPEKEYMDVNVKDELGSHNWYREKSNNNVRDSIEDGKGFSFFFARYAYLDKFKYYDESFVANPNPKYKAFASSIRFKNLQCFGELKKDKNIKSKLSPKNEILLMIHEDNRIIGATYTKDENILLHYIQNKSKKLVEQDLDKDSWLRERLETGIEKELYDRLINGYEEFSNFLYSLKNT